MVGIAYAREIGAGLAGFVYSSRGNKEALDNAVSHFETEGLECSVLT